MPSGTFDEDVEGIGVFTFRHRTIRDQFRIEGDASNILGGPVMDEMIRAGAVAFAALTVLTVRSPPGWDIEELDPFDSDAIQDIFKVHGVLRAAEERFRQTAADERSRARSAA